MSDIEKTINSRRRKEIKLKNYMDRLLQLGVVVNSHYKSRLPKKKPAQVFKKRYLEVLDDMKETIATIEFDITNMDSE